MRDEVYSYFTFKFDKKFIAERHWQYILQKIIRGMDTQSSLYSDYYNNNCNLPNTF